MKRSEVDREKLSPMMQQYMKIKDKYDDSIIFFRLGDFYEMFFEDAIIASRILELALTGKQAGLEERVPMCGIPYHAYASYVDTLVDKGYKVAICEQLEDPKETKGMVKRDVVQIVTKGTRLDSNIDAKSNNYIANINKNGGKGKSHANVLSFSTPIGRAMAVNDNKTDAAFVSSMFYPIILICILVIAIMIYLLYRYF